MVVDLPDKLIFTTRKIATQAVLYLHGRASTIDEQYFNTQSVPFYVDLIRKSDKKVYILMRDPEDRCWSGIKEAILNENDVMMNDLFYNLSPHYALGRDYCGSVVKKLEDNTLKPEEVLRGIEKVLYRYGLQVLKDDHIYTGYYTFIVTLLQSLPLRDLQKVYLVDIKQKKNKEHLIKNKILPDEIIRSKGDKLSCEFVRPRVNWWYIVRNITIESQIAYDKLLNDYKSMWYHRQNLDQSII